MKNWSKDVVRRIEPKITIEITKEDIVDIFSSAFGSGIRYWGEEKPNIKAYNEARNWLQENAKPDYEDGEICYEEILAQILFDGRSIQIIDKEGQNNENWLTLTNLTFGIQRAFREGYFSHYNWVTPDGDGFGIWHLNTSQIDAEVSDVIIQLAIFNEVIYG